ncbi:MAG: hemerythrin domain-containing protein [Chloroflexi bacterium]|nr:hemerythrin domain-containing protein [Chloroflexota bacterium]
MNAITLLKDDHQRVRDLFREIQSASAGTPRQNMMEQVLMEIAVHSRLEEEMFYPAVRAANGTMQGVVSQYYDEHHVIDQLDEDLKRLSPDDRNFAEKFQRLRSLTEEHMDDEERRLFPEATNRLGAQEVERLGGQMSQYRQHLIEQQRQMRRAA